MTTAVSTSLQRGFTLLLAAVLALAALIPFVAPGRTRAATPTDLFFSEYVEGSGDNQALEVFNGTGTPVDVLAGGYSIRIVSEGAISERTIALDGTASDVVASGDVFVVANSSASGSIQAAADQLAGGDWFGGDDTVLLLKGSTVLDVIGDVGSDPGDFFGAEPVTTQNHTLRRDPAISQGDTIGDDDFDPADEWIALPENNAVGLGSHSLFSAWINEIHYDNDGGDAGEGIEVAGVAGTDLSGWSLVLYNSGTGGTVYDTEALAGTIPSQQAGFGTVSFPISGIQNGPSDGIALVNGTAVVQFLSYEGVLEAVGGPADGMTSTDIGVTQPSNSPVGDSLQLTGNGAAYDDFTWAAAPRTFGAVNAGQSFGAGAITANCGPAVATTAGEAVSATVTASDPDGTVTAFAIDSVDPAPAAGTISVTSTTPAGAVGAVAEATVTVDAAVPAETYAVTVSASNDDATPQSGRCVLNVTVEAPLEIVPIGSIQGSVADTDDGLEHRAAAAPASSFQCSDEVFVIQGVVTQRIRTETDDPSEPTFGFFVQNTAETADDDPNTSDGLFVFTNTFTTTFSDDPDVGDFYFPVVGDEIVLQGRVAEFFNLTQFCNGGLRMLDKVAEDRLAETEITEADPPDDLADANRFWERHEGMRFHVPADSLVVAARDVFASTADAEVWVIRGDHPVAERTETYTNRVFRDPHPLDDAGPAGSFDNGNGYRIMLASHGLKWLQPDPDLRRSTMLAPARTFQTVTNEITGSLYFSFGKYAIEAEQQLDLADGADPSENAPPIPHDTAAEYATAPYNVENLYDFRDDPFDGCDFAGNDGCPGVEPPFDYVPASEADYEAHLGALADQILNDLHAPDILMVQEAEDQDICAVVEESLDCDDGVDNRDGKPDALQELGLAIAALGGPMYDAAYDRDGADDRGIVSGFLYRTDRVELLEADPSHPVLGSAPGDLGYSGAPLDYNTDVQNPKALNAELPPNVDVGDSCDVPDVDCVFTRDPQVGHFRVWRDGIGTSVFTDLYAISNHFSSTPDDRVEQRTEQAAYNGAIVAALAKADDGDRVVVGGDFNVFPRPDDPFPPPSESDQLAALYELGLHSLWEVVVDEAPASAYSYVFEGQAQTLDNQFVTGPLADELNGVRYAHVNADWPAAFDGDGSRGASDHDPQVARFDALTPDALTNLVELLLEAGAIDEGKASQLLGRLDRVADLVEASSMSAARAQLQAFGNQVDGLSPQWIDPEAALILQLEAELLAADL